MNSWIPGGIYDNIDKFANSLGYENASIALTLATIPWDSVDDRDSFIEMLTGEMPRGGKTKNQFGV
jgi:hypothetical protein